MATMDFAPNVHRLVVVGGSLGAVRVVEEARRIGFEGEVTVISGEKHRPYDRPPLSKEFLVSDKEPSPITYLDDAESWGVNIRTGVTALSLDTRNRLVRTSDGDVPYDAVVIATGAEPRTLGVPGAELVGVTPLRTLDHARAVREAMQPGLRIVVVGAGFIGGEVASSARSRGADVTLLEAMPLPLVRAVGPLVAERLAYLHRENGVDLRTSTKVREIAGSGRVEKVRLDTGESLAADLVVVGIGVDPATGWLRGSGVAVSDGVACNPFLESTVPGVYAVGDVARWVNPWNGQASRLEHWTSTGEQAAAVVRNALTTDREPCSITPYFWSEWYGRRLQLLGEPADEVELSGTGTGDPFLAQYRNDGELVGAFGLDSPGRVMKLRGAIGERLSWQDMLKKGAAS